MHDNDHRADKLDDLTDRLLDRFGSRTREVVEKQLSQASDQPELGAVWRAILSCPRSLVCGQVYVRRSRRGDITYCTFSRGITLNRPIAASSQITAPTERTRAVATIRAIFTRTNQ
ncbi:MAG: hypothetical protein J0I47_09460 [Sphingomonas sp.]|nr:hypothetical protein [Sphingomonas sp.]